MEIKIREHKTICKNLELHPDDQEVVNYLKNILDIKELKQGIEITSSSSVGMVKFKNFEVIVESKIPVNVLGLIEYALDFDDLKMKGDAGFESGDHLVDVLIDFFVEKCKKLVMQGLLKSYVTYRDDVSFLRGKLLVRQQLYHTIRKRPTFACEFDELEYDNLENQILLYCLKFCLNKTESARLKKEITILRKQLEMVVNYTEITLDDFEQIQYTRLNQHYESLHRLAKLIMESPGISEFSKHTAKSFFVDMNVIFEKFVTKLFDEHYPLKVESQKSKHSWSTEDKKLNIRTDLLLDSKTVLDIKYKEELSSSDLYQIGFYIHEYKQSQGYAILPAPAKTQDITSSEQNITISVRVIDVEKTLKLIYEKKHKELKDMLLDIIRID